MLNGKKLMCLTLLPTFLCGTLTTPPSAIQIIEKQVDIKNEVHIQNGIIKEPIEIRFQKDKIEFEKKKAEELKQQELKRLEEEKAKKEKEKQEEDNKEWKTFVLTFYSDDNSENGYGKVTCTGKRLSGNIIANNVYSLGTKIYLEGYGIKTVSDKGSDRYFSNDTNLDVFVERESNESNEHYRKRVSNYGRKTIRGYIIK